jgi:hypothetical protein
MPIPTRIQIHDRWYDGFLDGLKIGFVMGAGAMACVYKFMH